MREVEELAVEATDVAAANSSGSETWCCGDERKEGDGRKAHGCCHLLHSNAELRHSSREAAEHSHHTYKCIHLDASSLRITCRHAASLQLPTPSSVHTPPLSSAMAERRLSFSSSPSASHTQPRVASSHSPRRPVTRSIIPVTPSDVHTAFAFFDTAKRGAINVAELKARVSIFHPHLTPHELHAMMMGKVSPTPHSRAHTPSSTHPHKAPSHTHLHHST